MRSVIGATLVVGTLVASPAVAADYYLIESNANQISLVDADAIMPNQHGATAPMVAVRRAARSGGLSFAYAVVQTDFDCANRKIGSISLAIYERDGRPSAEQPGQGSPGVDWQPVNPNSQAGAAWEFVCAKPADRASKAFRLVGLPLDRIVTAIFDGTWPYDDVKNRRPPPQTKP